MRLEKEKLGETKRIQGTACGNGHVLFSIHGEGHWRGVDCPAHLKVPERFSRGSIQRDEISFCIAGEQQSTSSREHARPCRRDMAKLPLYLAACWIDSAQRTPVRLCLVGRKIGAAIISMAHLIGLRRRAEDVALLSRGYVKEIGSRIEAGGHPVRRAQCAWTNRSTLGRG